MLGTSDSLETSGEDLEALDQEATEEQVTEQQATTTGRAETWQRGQAAMEHGIAFIFLM